MADNTENQQPNTNQPVIEEPKFQHEGSVQIGCNTGIHELEITKLNPSSGGLTEVMMMCRRCGGNFTRFERLNINDILGGTNEPIQPAPQALAPQPVPTPQGSPQQKPQQAPQTAPAPLDSFKDADSFWESIKGK